ncbi:MAG: hypothetical protein HZR80_00390 [Candidatus Heimdallarchaeota archaeon]
MSEELGKETIVNDLERLTKISIKDQGRITKNLLRITVHEGEFAYQIIKLLLTEKIEKGYTKKYSLVELQKKIPLKRSRLIEKLQRVVKEGVLKHQKRKYMINKEHILVDRLWQYYNDANYKEREKTKDIINLIQENEQIEEEWIRERKYNKLTEKEEEKLREEMINETIADSYDIEDELKRLIGQNKVRIIGYKEM